VRSAARPGISLMDIATAPSPPAHDAAEVGRICRLYG
jgi:hypothetical protein